MLQSRCKETKTGCWRFPVSYWVHTEYSTKIVSNYGARPLEGRGFFCDQRGVMDHVRCARGMTYEWKVKEKNSSVA